MSRADPDRCALVVGDVVVGPPRAKNPSEPTPGENEVGIVVLHLPDHNTPWRIMWAHLDAQDDYKLKVRIKVASQRALARYRRERVVKIGHINVFGEYATSSSLSPPAFDADIDAERLPVVLEETDVRLPIQFTIDHVMHLAVVCRNQWLTFSDLASVTAASMRHSSSTWKRAACRSSARCCARCASFASSTRASDTAAACSSAASRAAVSSASLFCVESQRNHSRTQRAAHI